MNVSKEFLLSFFGGKRKLYPSHGVLLVGSASRGYSTKASDIDLMAFYNSGSQMNPDSEFCVTGEGHEITIEHHDLSRFIDEALDHRHNLSSLRMLKKVRDAVVLEADQELMGLIELAKQAHLDLTVMLWAFRELSRQWEEIKLAKPALQRHYMIQWAELLISLRLLCDKNAPSYSKPKWLYRNLRDGHFEEMKCLLDDLYQIGAARNAGKLEALEGLERKYLASFPEVNRGFIKFMGTECREMAVQFPEEAGPVFRFAANAYFWLLFAKDPLGYLRNHAPFRDAEFEVFYERKTPENYHPTRTLRKFGSFIRELGRWVVADISLHRLGSVMSRRFVPYFLINYNMANMLPYGGKSTDIIPSLGKCDCPDTWLPEVENFLEILESSAVCGANP